MNYLHRLIGILLLTGLSLPVALSAQSAKGPLSMEAAIAYAQSNSNKVRNAQVKIADAEQQIKEQLSTGLPQINGSLDFTHYLKVPVLPLPEAFSSTIPPGQEVPDGIAFQLKNNFVAGISASSMLFNGSFFVALRASREGRKLYQLELGNAERTVRNEVINSYLPLLLIRDNLNQLDKNITNLSDLLKETSAFYEAGFV